MVELPEGEKWPRTEEEKVAQALITVTFGGEEYQVKPLVIKDSREWRAKVIKLIAPLPQVVSTKIDTPDEFEQMLTELLVTTPDQVIDLFFEYAKDLKREDIESVATDAELAKAFEEVLAVAFPLAESAPKVITRLYPAKTKGSR